PLHRPEAPRFLPLPRTLPRGEPGASGRSVHNPASAGIGGSDPGPVEAPEPGPGRGGDLGEAVGWKRDACGGASGKVGESSSPGFPAKSARLRQGNVQLLPGTRRGKTVPSPAPEEGVG